MQTEWWGISIEYQVTRISDPVWRMAHGTWHMSFLQDYVCVRVAIYDVVKGLQQVVDEVPRLQKLMNGHMAVNLLNALGGS